MINVDININEGVRMNEDDHVDDPGVSAEDLEKPKKSFLPPEPHDPDDPGISARDLEGWYKPKVEIPPDPDNMGISYLCLG